MIGKPCCVIDASAALALLLSEELGPEIEDLIADAGQAGQTVLVPPLFWYEVGNGVVTAQRRHRLSRESAAAARSDLRLLPIATEPPPDAETQERIASIAAAHNLTCFDAAYAELALRHDIPLKTFDADLSTAMTRIATQA